MSVKKIVNCDFCGEENHLDVRYCPSCGENVLEERRRRNSIILNYPKRAEKKKKKKRRE